MTKTRVAVLGTVGKAIVIESDATIGATIGKDLKGPDGNILTVAQLQALLGVGATTGNTTAHRLLAGLKLGDDHPQYLRKDMLTTRGDLYARGASAVVRRPLGTVGQLLRSDGTDPLWATLSPVVTLGTDLSGNVTLTNLASGTLNAIIVNDAVTNSKLRNSGGLSVIGRAASTSGDPADILAAADGQVLRRLGATLGFGDIVLQSSNFANPTALVGPTVVIGSALTVMRSDAAPAIDLAAAYPWTGLHSYASTEPRQLWVETDQGADLKAWDWDVQGGVMAWRTRTDADGTGVNILAAIRGATTALASMSFGNATNNPVFNFLGTGTLNAGGAVIAVGGMSAARITVTLTTMPADGLFRPGTDRLGMTTGGSLRGEFNAQGVWLTYGATAYSGVSSPAQLVANTNNWSPTGFATASVVRASTDASRLVTGFVAPTTGRFFWLINIGAFPLELEHESASSTAANRLVLGSSANKVLQPGGAVGLWYDLTSARWRNTSALA